MRDDSAEVVELHPAGDGRWAWTYRRGDVALRSNRDYDDEAAARAGAAHAYPDVPVAAPPTAPRASPPPRRPSRRETVRAALAAAALGGLVYALRRRRGARH